MVNAPQVFISYSHADAAKAARLIMHLEPLRRDGTISIWFDRELRPGDDWREGIDTAIAGTDVALFLVTADFLASSFIRDIEVPCLLDARHAKGIPTVSIIVDHCDWKDIEWIERTQVLPSGGRPVTTHRPHSKAWTDVAQALRKMVHEAFGNGRRATVPVVAPPSAPPVATLHSLQCLLEVLPEGTGELFGRDEDLAFLDNALQNPDVAAVALVAFGGVGKSALVRHWLTRHVDCNRFRFIGCSFYDQGTHEHGGSSDQFLVEALRSLGDPEPNRGLLSLRARRLAELVSAEPTILILDGLEPLQFGPGVSDREGQLKDEAMRELLTAFLTKPGRSLCVITSRLPLKGPVFEPPRLITKSLEVLSSAAAVELLRSRGIRGSDTQFANAAKYLGYHALALVLAAEYLDTFHEGRVADLPDLPLIGDRTNQARHAKSVMNAYVVALDRDGNLLDLEILHILGLFDRPAAWEWIGALRDEPVIPGVTEHLVKATDQAIWESLSRLRQWGLVAKPQSPQDTNVDAHPLVREYFAYRLARFEPEGRRKAHERLYEYLVQNAERLPDTLPTMAPLMLAVAHGCKAGRYRDALHSVYLPRIMRGEEMFAANKLGAMTSLLAVLMQFFEPDDWRHPAPFPADASQALGVIEQFIVLSHTGMCLTALRGYAAPEVERCYIAARDLCLKLGETRELFLALYGLWRFYLVSGNARVTRDLALRLYALRKRVPNVHPAVADRVMCTTLYHLGEMERTAEHAGRGAQLRRLETAARDAVLYLNDPAISCLQYWGMSLWFLGDADLGRAKINEAVVLSRELRHAHTLALSLMYDAMLSELCGNADATRETSAELITLCTDEGYSMWRTAGEALHGWALTELGREREGTQQLESAMLEWAARGATLFRVYCLRMLTEIHLKRGRIAEGLKAVGEGYDLALAGEGLWEAEVCRLRGDLLLLDAKCDTAAVETLYLEALEIARRQGALALELRAAMSHGALLCKRGENKEAVTLLSGIYRRFVSGHDTADMRRARRLLAEWDD